jgi:phage terminase large subunit-like protein
MEAGKLEAMLEQLTPQQLEELKHKWEFWARPEQIEPETLHKNIKDLWVYSAGRGAGKALEVTTPIPTPDGWKEIGEIVAGDLVYDENGKICNVTVAHELFISDNTYKVNFSDGTSLVACGDHLWVTLTAQERKKINRTSREIPVAWAKKPSTTTQELFETQTYGKRGDRNHSIPLTQPVCGEDKGILIDPYCFGYWLGDGHSKAACITTADPEVVNYYEAAGYKCKPYLSPNCGAATTYSVGTKDPVRDPETGRMLANGSFQSALRELGVYDNKHVPLNYLRASKETRLEILRGMMDADGYIESSKVEFCTTKPELAHEFLELARSLGEKPTMLEGRAKLYGKDCGPKFRIFYRPLSNPFRLPRKANKFTVGDSQSLRNKHRMIVSVEPHKDTLVRCITVDSPNSMYLAGEGFIPTHNTRSGAEWVRHRVKCGDKRIACVAPTKGDVRRVMVEGNSGLLSVCWSGDKTYRGAKMGYPEWSPTNNTLTWNNGAKAEFFSAEDPERLRGPQFHAAWADEVAAWRNSQDVWDMLSFTLRLGRNPQVMITTTPKPTKLMRKLLSSDRAHITSGSTFDNKDNLAAPFLEAIKAEYEGTRLGQQELYAIMLEEADGALWTTQMLDECLIEDINDPVEFSKSLSRVVVAVDPAISANAESDMTGIVVAGVDINGVGYVLEDATDRLSPQGWASKVIELYHKYMADMIVAERNQGGEMVRRTIEVEDNSVPIRLVHAARGKYARAEPVSALYERGLVKHLKGLDELETQMRTWEPLGSIGSPDRLDACVWALTELMLKGRAQAIPRLKYEPKSNLARVAL